MMKLCAARPRYTLGISLFVLPLAKHLTFLSERHSYNCFDSPELETNKVSMSGEMRTSSSEKQPQLQRSFGS